MHDVLILHGGNPFLIQTMPHGVAGLVHGPDAAEGTIKHLKRIKDPVSLRYRTDSGDVIEVVCAQDDLPGPGSLQRHSGLAPDHYGLTGTARASVQPLLISSSPAIASHDRQDGPGRRRTGLSSGGVLMAGAGRRVGAGRVSARSADGGARTRPVRD